MDFRGVRGRTSTSKPFDNVDVETFGKGSSRGVVTMDSWVIEGLPLDSSITAGIAQVGSRPVNDRQRKTALIAPATWREGERSEVQLMTTSIWKIRQDLWLTQAAVPT